MAGAPSEAQELVLREYVRVLRRHKWVVVLFVLASLGVSLAFSFSRPKVYEAKAEVLLQRRSTENLFDALNDIRDPSRLAQTEMKVVRSHAVREAVERRLGEAPPVATSQSGIAEIIEIKANHTDPARAALIANAYAEAYVEFRRDRASGDIRAASDQVRASIDALQAEIDALEARARPADDRAAPAAALNPVIASQIASLTSQQGDFKQKLRELEVAGALSTGGAEVVNPAIPPATPVEPSPVRDGLVAVTVGLILGIGTAFLLEYLDDSVKTKEDLERAMVDTVPTLGLIPQIEPGDLAFDDVRGVVRPASPPAEAFRALRTSIQFLDLEGPKTLQVTSANRAEGKTTTSANLAAVIARAGKRVILVDCDLRRPQIGKLFGCSAEPGFTSILLGEATVAEALRKVPNAGELFVIPAGPVPPNPSELLSHHRTRELLKMLAQKADIVLIDSAPLLPVTDATVLAGQVSGVLLVVSAELTRRRPLQRSVELVSQVQGRLLGTVLNRVTAEDGYGYGYAYAADRGADGSSRRGRRKDERERLNGSGEGARRAAAIPTPGPTPAGENDA